MPYKPMTTKGVKVTELLPKIWLQRYLNTLFAMEVLPTFFHIYRVW